MFKWQLPAEAALLLLAALIALTAAGYAVPLFRSLLWLAGGTLVIASLWGAFTLSRNSSGRERAAPAGLACSGKPGPRRGGYRLLLVDVDGTLVGAAQAVSAAVREAVTEARAAGIGIALCTGRSLEGARRFANDLSLDGPHIFFDGALVASLSGPPLYQSLPDAAALREVAAEASAYGLPFELYTANGLFVATRRPESEWHAGIQGLPLLVADLDEVLSSGKVVKGELIGNALARSAIEALARRFEGRLRFSWASVPGYPQYDLINVVSPEASKGEALVRMAEALGIPLEDVAAVGDGPNDIPLLEKAGLGVAMGDAPLVVQEAADAVTAGIAEDGLAQAIYRFVLSGERAGMREN